MAIIEQIIDNTNLTQQELFIYDMLVDKYSNDLCIISRVYFHGAAQNLLRFPNDYNKDVYIYGYISSTGACTTALHNGLTYDLGAGLGHLYNTNNHLFNYVQVGGIRPLLISGVKFDFRP